MPNARFAQSTQSKRRYIVNLIDSFCTDLSVRKSQRERERERGRGKINNRERWIFRSINRWISLDDDRLLVAIWNKYRGKWRSSSRRRSIDAMTRNTNGIHVIRRSPIHKLPSAVFFSSSSVRCALSSTGSHTSRDRKWVIISLHSQTFLK